MQLEKCLEWPYGLQSIFFESAIVISFSICIFENFQHSRMASNEFFSRLYTRLFLKTTPHKFSKWPILQQMKILNPECEGMYIHYNFFSKSALEKVLK